MIEYSDLVKLFTTNLADEYASHQIVKGFGLYTKWEVGGASGGSCWGDEAESYVGDIEPEPFTEFEDFLSENNVTLKDYQKIRNLMHHYSWSDCGYYGNYSDYECRYYKLEEVFKLLCKCGYSLEESETLWALSKDSA